ncbi:MAG: Gfo/Idh/MocA family oxidoreductase [Clostridia bacterium]|nr:Gfo/Idh/MocA family oxidoreductase [Clostridia bacterium]
MKVKVGIVGTGSTVGIAHFHAEGLKKDKRAEITAVYNLNEKTAAAFSNAHGLTATICRTYSELLELVDAVVICTPNYAHIDYVVGAILNGKAVFVEKPLAVDYEECRKALSALENNKVFNMVGFVYRFSNHAVAVKKLVSEKIGKIYTITVSYGGTRLANPMVPLEWRMEKELSGSGSLGDFGSHLIDLLSFTCGLKVKHISCQTNTFIKVRPSNSNGKTIVENDDAAVFAVTGENGEICSVLTSRVGMDNINLCIAGEGGLLRADFSEGNMLFMPKAINGAYTGTKEYIDISFQKQFSELFETQMECFINGVLGQEVSICTIEEGAYNEKILSLAEESSHEMIIKTIS